jgi:hypothetical protein
MLAAIVVGILLSISAGVRMTIPLLAVNLLAFEHVIALPHDLAWLGTQTTLILLSAAFVVETIVHFIPAAGTALKAAATPLAFVAGTLLMAVPLGDKNPLFQWILAGAVGGGAATLTHLGTTGVRAATGPFNLASGGMFGVGWNMVELAASVAFIFLSYICVAAGWVVAVAILAMLGIAACVLTWKTLRRFRGRELMTQDEALP